MVLISAVIPAPEEGSNPAIVSTTGGACGIAALYRMSAPAPNASRFLTLPRGVVSEPSSDWRHRRALTPQDVREGVLGKRPEGPRKIGDWTSFYRLYRKFM